MIFKKIKGSLILEHLFTNVSNGFLIIDFKTYRKRQIVEILETQIKQIETKFQKHFQKHKRTLLLVHIISCQFN